MAAQGISPAGSSEFLSSLLTKPDHTCPHDDKTKTRQLPKRLGFSGHQDGTITFLNTDKLCQDCYNLAVPDGFCVWSTDYKPSERPIAEEHRDRVAPRMMDSEEWSLYYGSKATLQPPRNESAALRLPMSDDYYPLMWEAGMEDEPNYEPKRVRMPVNARYIFRKIQDSGQPFYIDQLHLTQPWDPNAADQDAEDRRVARENNVAYQEASRWHIGTGVGGAGANSIAEQRILTNRGIPMADGPNVMNQVDGTGYLRDDTAEEEAHRFGGQKVREVPTNWPEGYRMPAEERINAEEFAMTGNVTGPTDEERERRRYLEPNHGHLGDSSEDNNDSAGGDNDTSGDTLDSSEGDNNSAGDDNDSPEYEGNNRSANEEDNDVEYESDSIKDDSD